jgi:hypothetical protein
VYEFAPPAPAEILLRTEATLSAKIQVASRLIGAPAALTTATLATASGPSASVRHEALRVRLERWLATDSEPRADAAVPLIAVVRGAADALLVATRIGDVVLAGREGGSALSTAAALLARVCSAAEGPDIATERATIDAALREVAAWIDRHVAARDAGLDTAVLASTRRGVLARIAAIVRCAPAHRRPQLAGLAAAARSAVAAPLNAGIEHRLSALSNAPMPDEQWLRELVRCASSAPERPADQAPAVALIALIVVTAPREF